jgi:hypothetical protein
MFQAGNGQKHLTSGRPFRMLAISWRMYASVTFTRQGLQKGRLVETIETLGPLLSIVTGTLCMGRWTKTSLLDLDVCIKRI